MRFLDLSQHQSTLNKMKKVGKINIYYLKCIFHIPFLFVLGDEPLDNQLARAWRALFVS